MKTYIAKHNPDKCRNCGWCSELVACPGADKLICIGCGACVPACPNNALELVEEPREKEVTIEVDGKRVRMPEKISVKAALDELGCRINVRQDNPAPSPYCGVGACWDCVVEIDGTVKPSCVTGIEDGMKIKTELPEDYTPKRIVLDFMGHEIGGVGTPWQERCSLNPYVEAICMAAGCNFRCPQCYNWTHTYRGTGEALTPAEAAERLSKVKEEIKVNRMLISGGECTLNRPWLIRFLRELKKLNPDPQTRLHVQTNGSLLTCDYIDELVDAGMTDIGLDLKALETDTFIRITGVKNEAIARKYMDRAWDAVRYIVENYREKVFIGIGIPYNRELNSIEEIAGMGEKLYSISPSIQVVILRYLSDYRSKILPPDDDEIEYIRDMLKRIGLKTVLAWTEYGETGP